MHIFGFIFPKNDVISRMLHLGTQNEQVYMPVRFSFPELYLSWRQMLSMTFC